MRVLTLICENEYVQIKCICWLTDYINRKLNSYYISLDQIYHYIYMILNGMHKICEIENIWTINLIDLLKNLYIKKREKDKYMN